MKQTIRINCFETNSSSYHSLSINIVKPTDEIIPGKDLTISSKINIRYIGDTSSYVYVARGSYEKAQLILRFISGEVEEQVDALIDDTEWKNGSDDFNHYDWDRLYELRKAHIYEIPLIKAFVKKIKDYIGDYNVNIELSKSGTLESVYDSNKSIYDILNVTGDDLNNVDTMSNLFKDYIFNNNIEIVEECESNE